ncbi:RagB/SusD family nutrient uptake outer membrane protein [Pedobacter agri]|uniref:RagB/SusD family nutrient uptake outer membrane protein n=1 Tax=Pedobacter agri TaxID=454586 RepID=UPI00292E8BCC|nr:RagB/SusD family nutrient uptake outer membrane protein [Pedobacter agri]
MKTKSITTLSLALLIGLASSCKKTFLDAKPSSDILSPTSLSELKSLLDATERINLTGALSQIASDEYNIISAQNYQALPVIQRNGYIWAKDTYAGEKVDDWNNLFQSIFYANSVLEVLGQNNYKDQTEANRIKGWAHFIRAYAYYDLAKNFCKVYNSPTAKSDLGLPIRLSAGVDEIAQRSSLEVTFAQILSDINLASSLLDPAVPPLNKNRPSRAASLALKARVLLYMGNYNGAESAADSTLLFHDRLTDYNTISTTSETPFTSNAEEVIYSSTQIYNYASTTASGNRPDMEVNPALYASFSADDLRRSVFFRINILGRINMKRGYISTGIYPFTGLATDEIILIKAECLARKGETQASTDILNKLLVKRLKKTVIYKPIIAQDASEALKSVLAERGKELIWRGLRWSDLKRYNRDGAGITLTRTLNNITHTFSPNDPRYVFQIPDQEILQSGIEQN